MLENIRPQIKPYYKYILYGLIGWENENEAFEQRQGILKAHTYLSKDEMDKVIEPLREIRKKYKFEYFESKNGKTNFCVMDKGKEQLLIWRGTDNNYQWVQNFIFFKEKFRSEQNKLKNIFSKEDFEDLIIENYLTRSEESAPEFATSILENMNLVSPSNLFKNDVKSSIDVEGLLNRICFHAGFLNLYNSLTKDFENAILKRLSNPKVEKVTICGFSLGAGLGKLSYIFTLLNHPEYADKLYCVVGGVPRIGNIFLEKLMYERFGNKYRPFLINTESDMVSMVPPVKFGYFKPTTNLLLKDTLVTYPTMVGHFWRYYLDCMEKSDYILTQPEEIKV